MEFENIYNRIWVSDFEVFAHDWLLVCKNYVTKEDIKIIDQKSEKENNKTKISLSIPSIKDKTTPDTISAQYYLKVYNYSNKDIFVNGTISLVDKLEPYKI